MKFIRKHTEGSWADRIMVKSVSNSITISECSSIGFFCDALLISQAPAMLDYLIERAGFLEKEIEYADSVADHFELIGFTEPEKREELSRLLEIIKAAGVEVVND